MERLTKRLEDGQAIFHECHGTCGTCDGANCYCIGPMVDRLAAYEDTGLEPEEIKEIMELCTDEVAKLARTLHRAIESGEADHLRDLLKADNEGRLVVLPSKTVWELTMDAGPDCDLKCPVDAYDEALGCDLCSKAKPFAYERPCTQERLKGLGKTVFLTREEAEDAMKEATHA